MYTKIFFTIDEGLESCTTHSGVIERLNELGHKTSIEQIDYLKEYMGVIYDGSFNGGLIKPEEKRDFIIKEFLNNEWREMTNKYIMYDLRYKIQ